MRGPCQPSGVHGELRIMYIMSKARSSRTVAFFDRANRTDLLKQVLLHAKKAVYECLVFVAVF